MLQSYKILFGKQTIVVENIFSQPNCNKDDEKVHLLEDKESILSIINSLTNIKKKNKITVIYPEPYEIISYLKEKLNYTRTSGGLVINKSGKLLLIKQNNKWVFPKGRSKKGEKNKKTALREVTEECGVKNLIIKAKVDKSYQIITVNKNLYFKETNWYLIYAVDDYNIRPGKGEGIKKVYWIEKKNIQSYLPFIGRKQRYLIQKFYL